MILRRIAAYLWPYRGRFGLAFLQVALNRNSASWGAAAPGGIRALAVASIVFWTAGMVTGRLIAYLV